MESTISVNSKQLPIKECNGQRVVTFKEIDAVHGRKDGTAHRNFKANRNRFIEGVDFFRRNSSEADVYRLIMHSKLPSAERFERWVFDEVLPSIRKYGVYAVERLLNDPDTMIQALTALKEEREKRKHLEEKLNDVKPKVVFATAVECAKTFILVGELAKLLKQNGIDTGEKRLFEDLRNDGYLMKGGTSKNMPTQKSMELGLFEIRERTVNAPDGNIKITKTPYVAGKGQTYFINRYLKAAT